MRKKSHILLARYIADQMEHASELQDHRKAFCLGSILPDIKPSFLTVKHEFGETFYDVEREISRLAEDCLFCHRNKRVYWRRLGEVIHYVADYFTFPHNTTFSGTLMEHGKYEKELKHKLKKCILNGHASVHLQEKIEFENAEDLAGFIEANHRVYLSKKRNVKEDIEFIINICYQVAQGIFNLLTWQNKSQFCCA